MSKPNFISDFLNRLDKHKKLIKIIGCIVNAIFVLILFFCSAFLLYYVKAPAQTVFGYNGVLVKDDLQKSATFVFLDKKTAVPTVGSEFLYVQNSGLRVCEVTAYANNEITFLETETLSLSDPEYGGQVLWQSEFIGKILAPFSSKRNLPLVYLMIIALSLLCLLLLTLIYIFTSKRNETAETEKELEREVEREVENQKVADKEVTYQEILEEKVAEEKVIKQAQLKEEVLEKEVLREVENKIELPIELPIEQPIEQPIDDDDMPSIDSLMDEISKLSGKWDDDMKMYR